MEKKIENIDKNENTRVFKGLLYVTSGILIISIILFFIIFINYSKNLNKLYGELKQEEIAQIEENNDENTEEIANNIGKKVEEIETEENTQESKQDEQENNDNSKKNQEEQQHEKEPVIEDPTFVSPVSGDIITEYAKDNLIYSKTLEEWITHFGIDICAEQATVVKAASSGTVTAIKNDPRYGNTIIIQHNNGYETRYANLLTTEFVTIGEQVEQGQTIGTIGNSASFEIMEKPHLHFELLINSEYQNPSLFITE